MQQSRVVVVCLAVIGFIGAAGCGGGQTTSDDAGGSNGAVDGGTLLNDASRPVGDAGGGSDSGTLVDGGGATDGGGTSERDAGAVPVDSSAPALPDAAEPPLPDAGPPVDGGPPPLRDQPLGALCHGNAECASGACNRTIWAACLGLGRCVEPVVTCPASTDPPVCGCDGTTYASTCELTRAGVALDYRVPCDPPGECTARTPRNCCYDDEDCLPHGEPVPVVRRCGGQRSCGSGTMGVCLPVARTGECWVDSDCPDGQRCDGELVYACGEPVAMIQHSGTCVGR